MMSPKRLQLVSHSNMVDGVARRTTTLYGTTNESSLDVAPAFPVCGYTELNPKSIKSTLPLSFLNMGEVANSPRNGRSGKQTASTSEIGVTP